MTSIYRTPAGRAQILAAYDQRLASLALPVESRVVDTRAGSTHLLIAGPETGRPLVLMAGANGSALDFAEALGSFAEHHRCYYLDVPGEPNRSSEQRPSKADDSFGRWMEDVLDSLSLERTAMLGMSGGGFVTLKCCAVIPERLSRVALLVPQGLASPRPFTALRKLTWPLLRHRLFPSEANARRFLEGMATEEVPDLAVTRLHRIMRHVTVQLDTPPLFTAEDLAGLKAPVLIVAGGRDVVFPGDRIAERAPQVIPNLREVILLPNANHGSMELFFGPAMERVRAFLSESDPL